MADFDIMNVEVEEAKEGFDDYSYTIMGSAGVGKSTLAQYLFEDSAFLTLDNNHEHIRGKKIPAPDWKTIKGYAKTLTKAFGEGKEMPFRTLIVDTSGVGAKLCQDYVCRVNGWSHPSDGAYGQGWDAVKTEWNMTWKAFKDCGIKIVHVVHDKDKEFKVRDGEKYNQIVPDVGATFNGEVIDGVNFIFYITNEIEKDKDGNILGEKRVIHSRRTSEYVAKSHFANFPEHLDYQESPKATAELIKAEFKKAVELEFGGKKAKKEDKPPKKDKDKEKVKDIVPVAEDTVVVELVEEKLISLDVIKGEIESILKNKLTKKEMTPSELTKVVQENTGVKMIKDIDSIEKAKKLLNAII